ncbi:hypothetical protein DJ568_01935 [Mucilaginibacter hurinus]|uniref:Glycosyl transferase family 1 domain-containing protein n=1 Tax=Mucilaginibacter hurinus TaxID=2201324 RepID=A0A367GT87_9SPHI|nr:glycosyltransferase family 4 protein [Mucilaginibacter hurinus]RCH56644.1 hypothetical protein DJ568_01935 [Mucilaginibacter hurinus]
MPKRVLYSIYQTTNHSNGGVNSMTQILEQDADLEPVILTNREGPFNARWKARGWKIIKSNIKWGSKDSKQGRLAKIADIIKSNYLAYRTLKSNKLKALYCNDIQGFWCAYFGGRMAGAKVIFNLRDTKSADELSSLKKWTFIAQKADIIVVLSEEMKDFVLNKLLDGNGSQKIFVTYSIVKHDLFKPVDKPESDRLRAELGIPLNQFAISYVAAFNEKKAQLPFIQQVVSKFKDTADAHFYFIGDFHPDSNDYARQCLDAVKEMNIEHLVSFIGHDSRMDRWYKVSDLVAIASNKEGLARCMIEAISCGTPVISFDVCSAREILEERECGEVIGMNNYDDFYQAILQLKNEPARLTQYGKNGVALSKALFSKDAVMEKYQNIYNKIATFV